MDAEKKQFGKNDEFATDQRFKNLFKWGEEADCYSLLRQKGL